MMIAKHTLLLEMISAFLIHSAMWGVAAGADTGGTPKQMFQSPRDWKFTPRSESVLFYDAPDLKKDEGCRIAVMSPSELGGGFKEWFALVQAPDDVVEQSKLVEGKSKGGYETLRLSKVVKKPSGNELHRLYYGLRDGNRFALILCTAPNADLLKTAAKEAEVIVNSWDFSKEFPTTGKIKE